jgi:hypothetical protein
VEGASRDPGELRFLPYHLWRAILASALALPLELAAAAELGPAFRAARHRAWDIRPRSPPGKSLAAGSLRHLAAVRLGAPIFPTGTQAETGKAFSSAVEQFYPTAIRVHHLSY